MSSKFARSRVRSLVALFAGVLLGAAACGHVVAPPRDEEIDAQPAELDARVPSPLGAACSAAVECASGTCVDDVCCATACDGVCSRCDLEGHAGTCTPVPSGTVCGDATCDEGAATAAPRCNGNGTCVAVAPESCGAYVCADETACHDDCAATGDAACRGGLVCAAGMCAPASCTDQVRTPPETDVDCGGGNCPDCAAGRQCQAGADCESGTCASATATCTAPTYAWRTSAYGACGAGACAAGVQARTVWCERSDGTTVDDARCTAARPTPTQACTNTTGCAWYAGAYGTCTARCGGGSQTRSVYCRDLAGAQVPNTWCSGAPPSASTSCNTFPCVVNVAAGPTASMGPCWSPPNCLGGYPAFPSCPAGYVATRSETGCGNPHTCGGNWALCTFYSIYHTGCFDVGYVMGVAARECTYQ